MYWIAKECDRVHNVVHLVALRRIAARRPPRGGAACILAARAMMQSCGTYRLQVPMPVTASGAVACIRRLNVEGLEILIVTVGRKDEMGTR